MTAQELRGAKIVVTGVTGSVGGPLARRLAVHNEVYGAARFADQESRRPLEEAGIRCVRIDLAAGEVADLPADADYVCNFAVSKSNDWGTDLDANVGGLGALMSHHREARAFLHCSTTGVYRPDGHRPLAEEDALGDNHGVWPFLRTYSISKIAAEGMARWGARHYDLPTTISRLSVPYGDGGGWPAVHLEMLLHGTAVPVHTNAPSQYHPIHDDDIARMVPGLLECAASPATVVNWGGSEPVAIEEWCGYLAELTGLDAHCAPTDQTIESVRIDPTRMHQLVGETEVPWRDGMRRMVQARHPELLTGLA